jgi:hypothetical protein
VDLLPAGVVLQERHPGRLGFEGASDLGAEQIARSLAVEACEAVEDAGDEEIEGHRFAAG